MPSITGVSHVDLTVSDLDRSTTWYSDLLGLNLVLDGSNEEHGFLARYLMHNDTGLLLGLIKHQVPAAGEFDPHVTGLDHLSFAVTDRDALKEWSARLDELGIDHAEIEEQPYGASLDFRDPDGIQLEFYVLGGLSA